MKRLLGLVLGLTATIGFAADTVPNEIQQPGTQPGEIGNLESHDGCDNCRGRYDADSPDLADCGNDPVCQVDCLVCTTKNLCNAQPACQWSNQSKACVNN